MQASTNPYIRDFYDQAKHRFNSDTGTLTNLEWLEKETKIKGRKFSVDRYPFQEALINDDSRNSVCQKPSQVGVSEIYQRVALMMLARNPYKKGIYAYPDDAMRLKNVQARVQPMVEETEAFNKGLTEKPIRSINVIQIATSFLYMTGSKTNDATSTDADFVFLDEFDLHDMKIASLFASRLQNSDWKINRKFSTPTYTLFGVHGEFHSSDQTSYLIQCGGCNHWQFPLFNPNFVHVPNYPSDKGDFTELDEHMVEHYGIDLSLSYVKCEKCGSRLDLGRRDNRAWISNYPSRTRRLRGWKINPFSVATRPPEDIFTEMFNYKKLNFIRGFKNSVLGEPEDAGQNRLEDADIRACLGSREVPPIDMVPTWVGIDMGQTCHVTVAQGYDQKSLRAVRMDRVPMGQLTETVEGILNKYHVVGGCTDRFPETTKAEEIRDLSGGRILPCEYRGQKEVNVIKYPDKDEPAYIQVNRTSMLDAAAKQVRNGYIQFNGFGMLAETIVTQFRNMVRDDKPGQETEVQWVKLDENDHFFHSLALVNAAIRSHDVQEKSFGIPQSVIMIAGADMVGYTPTLFGNAPSPNKRMTSWLNR